MATETPITNQALVALGFSDHGYFCHIGTVMLFIKQKTKLFNRKKKEYYWQDWGNTKQNFTTIEQVKEYLTKKKITFNDKAPS